MNHCNLHLHLQTEWKWTISFKADLNLAEHISPSCPRYRIPCYVIIAKHILSHLEKAWMAIFFFFCKNGHKSHNLLHWVNCDTWQANDMTRSETVTSLFGWTNCSILLPVQCFVCFPIIIWFSSRCILSSQRSRMLHVVFHAVKLVKSENFKSDFGCQFQYLVLQMHFTQYQKHSST